MTLTGAQTYANDACDRIKYFIRCVEIHFSLLESRSSLSFDVTVSLGSFLSLFFSLYLCISFHFFSSFGIQKSEHFRLYLVSFEKCNETSSTTHIANINCICILVAATLVRIWSMCFRAHRDIIIKFSLNLSYHA